MRKIVLLLLICAAFKSVAQNEYIVKDSAYRAGEVKLISADRIQFTISGTQQTTVYSIDDLKEYKVGRYAYERLSVKGKSDFYKKYISGRANLYRVKRAYAIRINENLTIIEKKKFRSTIASTLNCEESKNLSLLSYSAPALTQAVEGYNKGNCNFSNFPHKKFGILAGYEASKLIADARHSSIRPEGSGPGLIISAFADLPVFYSKRWLYMYADASWSSSNAILFDGSAPTEDFFAVNTTSINLMVGLKAVKSNGRIRPYLKASPVIGFANLNSPTGLIGGRSGSGGITPYNDNLKPEKVTRVGYSVGAGVQIPIIDRKTIFLEVRGTKLSTDVWDFKLTSTTIAILGGISI